MQQLEEKVQELQRINTHQSHLLYPTRGIELGHIIIITNNRYDLKRMKHTVFRVNFSFVTLETISGQRYIYAIYNIEEVSTISANQQQ